MTFVRDLRDMINSRKKMTSRLYQVILSGNAPQRLLKNFVIHRYPIKNFWTRNILGIASRIDDYGLRSSLIENIYEEETGAITKSKRHLDTFADFGTAVGVTAEELHATPLLPQTKALIEHNLEVCNSSVHFTAGVASVLLLMEGQPPIMSQNRTSMLDVMRDVYLLPAEGYEFFVHHASSTATDDHVSALEDDHAQAAERILSRYCITAELQEQAKRYLQRAIDLRHAHFDAIHDLYHKPGEAPFRYRAVSQRAVV